MVGGAVRTEELVEPGFRNDVFSAFYPLAVASPAMRAMELERCGVRWCHGPLVLAHPTSDGRCVALSRDLEETAASLDTYAEGDGAAWRELMELWGRIEPAILRGLATPVPPVRAGVSLLARLGPRGALELARTALLPVRRFAEERFDGEGAALLIGGNALHTDLAPESTLGAFFGFVLAALGQTHGYPFPEGGAGAIAAALARRAEARGARIACATPVERILVERAAGSSAFAPGHRHSCARSCSPPSRVWELDRLLGRERCRRGRAGSGSGEGRLDARRAGPVDGPRRAARPRRPPRRLPRCAQRPRLGARARARAATAVRALRPVRDRRPDARAGREGDRVGIHATCRRTPTRRRPPTA